ncbi:regulator of G-protein signaling protein-like [Puntigrus tetrazona]|uniref:regulator of G-protein signaling protein-like n=1 Tax=Puntigrus tetrazona TaxID=1606681 RepID=UPI001C88F017|nr:regulator of G-protein signaling protein-like [Puntigrus tetrazona]
MRKKALCRLQSYWLPQFLHCCKSWLWRVPECQPIVEKYTAFSFPPAPSPSSRKRERRETNPTLSPAESYCSKLSKRLLWSSREPSAVRSQSSSICLWLPAAGQEHPQCSNIAHPPQRNAQTSAQAVVRHTCAQTPACQIPCRVNVRTPPSDVLSYLQPALSAEALAASPFRSYLRDQDLVEKQQMLDLLEDLDFFLQLVLKAQGEDPVCSQRQAAARQIIEKHLKENMPCCERLDSNTSQHLRSLLPSSAAVPWIYRAKYEICKELQDVYDSFLDAEDKALVSHLFQGSRGEDTEEELLFCGFETETEAHFTQTEALVLCGGCCSRLEPDALSQDSWALVGLQDPQGGGSLLHKYNTDASEESSSAAESDVTTPLVQDVPESKAKCSNNLQMKTLKKDSVVFEKPSTKPRSFEEVLASSQYAGHFRRFLQEHSADGALLFLQEAESLRTLEPKRQKAKIRAIVDKFFRRQDAKIQTDSTDSKIFIKERKRNDETTLFCLCMPPCGCLSPPAVEYLQCSADIISSVPKMDTLPPEVIFTVQHLVAKTLETTWFKQYQEAFYSCSPVSSESNLRRPLLLHKLKTNAWTAFSTFIRSVTKFLSALEDRDFRTEFEDYLIHDYKHFSQPCCVRSKAQQSSDISSDGEKFKPKMRSVKNKMVVADFLVNDLSFYMECERFRHLADAGDIMASEGMYSENDYATLHQKAELIISVFLHSNLSPKLMINTSEAQKDSILQRFASRKVDRTLFYPAMMEVFPVLVFCWKKFCCLKVMKRLYPAQAPRKQKASSLLQEQHPLNVLREIKTVRSSEGKIILY